MTEVQFITVSKDGCRLDFHPQKETQNGGGPSLKDTTAESGQKKAAKKAEVK